MKKIIIIILISVLCGLIPAFSQSDEELSRLFMESMPRKIYYWAVPKNPNYAYDQVYNNFAPIIINNNNDRNAYSQVRIFKSGMQNDEYAYFYYIPTVDDSLTNMTFIKSDSTVISYEQNNSPYAANILEAELMANKMTTFGNDLIRYYNLIEYFDDYDTYDQLGVMSFSIGCLFACGLIGDYSAEEKKKLGIISLSFFAASGILALMDEITDGIRDNKRMKVREELLNQINSNRLSKRQPSLSN